METKTTSILITPILVSEMKKTLTFREITETEELEKAFRFRYVEYSKTKNRNYLKENSDKIDLDVFDLHSRHFGLFAMKNDLVGYLRVVHDKNEFYNSKVFEVGKILEIFSDSLHSKECLKRIKMSDFPFLSYPNLPKDIYSHYCSLKEQNESFAEASRLILREDYRGLRTSCFLIECAMALFVLICNEQKHAVLHCCKDHRSFYEHYGFQPFDGGTGYNEFGMVKHVMYLKLSSWSAPVQIRDKFQEMANEYSKTGKITRTI